jgi:arylsulfatase A-like enzyme
MENIMANAARAMLILSMLWLTASASVAQERPNILFCIADDASYPHMGAYGCKWVKSPGFDRVARDGLLFTRAYTPNAKCAPSRACILTGRNSWQLKEACNHVPHFPVEFTTYAEALGAHGYFVGKTAKGWAPGQAVDQDGQPRQLTGTPFDKRRAEPPTRAISGNDYAANFQDFLDATPDSQPWCFWYGSTEPHRAYEYGSGVAKGGKSLEDIPAVPSFWPDNETVRHDMLDYALEIEYFDLHLCRMLELLEERGQLSNTLVVVTADNGMPFPRIKGQEYELSNHLPLAIMWKRGITNPGRVIDDFVSFIDFAPTFLEVAGLAGKQSGMQPITGRSLTEIFNSDKSGQVVAQRDHVLIGKERHDVGRPHDWGYPIRGIVKGDLLFLQNFKVDRWPAGNPETGYLNTDGSPTKTEILRARKDPTQRKYWLASFGKRPAYELYNIKRDPECMNNLAEDPAFRLPLAELRYQLLLELGQQQDPRIAGTGDIFDQYEYADPKTRGFYERYMSGDEQIRAGWVNATDFEKPLTDQGDEAGGR